MFPGSAAIVAPVAGFPTPAGILHEIGLLMPPRPLHRLRHPSSLPPPQSVSQDPSSFDNASSVRSRRISLGKRRDSASRALFAMLEHLVVLLERELNSQVTGAKPLHLWTPLQTQAENWVRRVVGCCHLSGLILQNVLQACMGVRGSNPNQVRVLCAHCNGLVF